MPAPETKLLDLSGRHCPEVVLRVKSRLTSMPAGAVLAVISTDPLSAIDVPLFARRLNIRIEKESCGENAYLFRLHLPESWSGLE